MKKTNLLRNAFYGIMSVAIAATVTSCGDDASTPTAADKAELNVSITECDGLATAATTVAYPQAAIDAFKAVLAAAKTVADDADASQTAVDNVKVQLDNAKEIFLAAAFAPISADGLICGFNFDEGSATTTELTSAGRRLVATLETGPAEIFGAATNKPSFIAGKVGKAIYFNNGSHLEIATYSATDFQGSALSIAVWVKPDSTRAGNYIISYNYWNSWKFQLQEQNKPFFTVSTSAGGVDADNQSDFSAQNDAWTHLVVSLNLTTHTLAFYVNGALSLEWDATGKDNLSGTAIASYATNLPIIIGACTTFAEAEEQWTWGDGWKTPVGWDNFVGAMDELKVYNIALTEGQVSKLYADEQ
ncbi:hypothetical protein FACS189452_05880 [Bacteroidia bacterium]|nr:hypothetical protein FACS189452_05880 [Bacteroidia bacterium]